MTVTTEVTLLGQDTDSLTPTDLAARTLAAPKAKNRAPRKRDTMTPTEAPQNVASPTWRALNAQSQPGKSAIRGLEKWEGKILEIDADIFTAELYPIDSEGMPITADFKLELLGSDADSADVGDVFYLFVRTVTAYGKRPTHTETLRLRRLGRITSEEVRAVYAKADALMGQLEQLFD